MGLLEAGAVIVILDLDQQLALFHLLKIIDRDPAHITLDLGAERRDVAAGIGVVGGLANTGANPDIPPGNEERHDHAG